MSHQVLSHFSTAVFSIPSASVTLPTGTGISYGWLPLPIYISAPLIPPSKRSPVTPFSKEPPSRSLSHRASFHVMHGRDQDWTLLSTGDVSPDRFSVDAARAGTPRDWPARSRKPGACLRASAGLSSPLMLPSFLGPRCERHLCWVRQGPPSAPFTSLPYSLAETSFSEVAFLSGCRFLLDHASDLCSGNVTLSSHHIVKILQFGGFCVLIRSSQ